MAIPVIQPVGKDRKFPAGLLIFGILAAVFGAVSLLFFIRIRPEIAPPVDLLDRFLPAGSTIRQIEAIELDAKDIESVLNHPVFRTLKEAGPVPLVVPQTGKQNLFF